MSKVKCYNCQKFGHYANDCTKEKKVHEQSNLIKEDEEPTLLMALINEDVKDEEILLNEKEIEPKLCTNSNNTLWYLDNGASNHMTRNHEHFKEIDENVTGQVRFGDGNEPGWIEFVVNQSPTPTTGNSEGEFANNEINDSARPFEHTPIKGFRSLDNVYERAPKIETTELLFTEEEPQNYKEASVDKKWIEAMQAEIDSINKNNTWNLTDLPSNHKAIGLKWVFKTKRDASGNIIKHKARLVAKGYVQQHGIDFDEVFAPVARIETVCLILALAAYNGWEVHHLDVKSTFLHGELKEEVNVTQPEGFVKPGNARKVYKLSKALKEIELFKSQMEEKFEMSDLGLLAYYLGIEVTQLGDATEHRSLIGCLRYLLHTRPGLSYSIGLLSRFMQEPKEHHLKAIRQVLRYIKGTKDFGITYKRNGSCEITGYSDSSYGVNTEEGKGTTSIVFYFGNSPITWCTQKQQTVALSSCESEFMAATAAACQALWLKRLLSEITRWKERRITLYVDNISAIALMKNLVFHGRSLHQRRPLPPHHRRSLVVARFLTTISIAFLSAATSICNHTMVIALFSAAEKTIHNSHKFAFKLSPTNYGYWKAMIQPFLITNSLYCYVDGTLPCPPAMLQPPTPTDKDTLILPPQPYPDFTTWVSNNAHVCMLIISTVSEASFAHVQGNTSQETWLSFERAYAPKTSSREFTLRNQLLRITMKDKDLVMLVVAGLRDEYNALKSIILTRQFPTSFIKLYSLFADHDYMMQKPTAPAPSAQAFMATTNPNSRSAAVPGFTSVPPATLQVLQQLMSQLGLKLQPSQSNPTSQAFYTNRSSNNRSRGRGRTNHNTRNQGDRSQGGGNRSQFSWASTQNTVYGTCNRCGIELGERPKKKVFIKRTGKKENALKVSFIEKIEMLARFEHPSNQVSFLGFCDEEYEMILVFEYTFEENLEYYWDTGCRWAVNILEDSDLTWQQRIWICLDIAHGLQLTTMISIVELFEIHPNLLLPLNFLLQIAMALLASFSAVVKTSHYAHKFGFTLSPTNYGFWKAMIKPFLITNNLFGYIDGTIPCPPQTLPAPTDKDEPTPNPNYQIWIANDAHVKEQFMIPSSVIVTATENFDKKYCIGSGGFGEVYKAKLNLSDIESCYGKKLRSRCDSSTMMHTTYMMQNQKGLASIARRHVKKKTLKELLDVELADETSELGLTQDKRPTIQAIIQDLEKALELQESRLRINKFSLEHIKEGTNNFSVKGGHGMYEGTIQGPKGHINVLLKRFTNQEHGFLKAIEFVFNHNEAAQVEEIVFEELKKHILRKSFTTFRRIAIQCLHEKREERPRAGDVLQELQKALKFLEKEHLVEEQKVKEQFMIPRSVIVTATENFDKKYFIGSGGFGEVYKAKLNLFDIESCYGKKLRSRCNSSTMMHTVAIKRLNDARGRNSVLSAFAELDALCQWQVSTINTIQRAGTPYYIDPEYDQTGRLKKSSDIYSFGVVLFEIFSGKLAFDDTYILQNPMGLAPIARNHFQNKTLKKMLDAKLMDEASELGLTSKIRPDQHSLDVFSNIAYQCLSRSQDKRPKIQAVIQDLEKALQLQECRISDSARNLCKVDWIIPE
ncbi:hypothetical protein E3N88_28548 [Mikania micrantha]|uniref:CCHC-type domain-containing protein n=1 Tax=Mikania micrantha TaxID=192012 RepID=A0A5N6N0Y0_9ASTR|nr:hypothetical protein E3N88_28548 [Mikania micrantha]